MYVCECVCLLTGLRGYLFVDGIVFVSELWTCFPGQGLSHMAICSSLPPVMEEALHHLLLLGGCLFPETSPLL